MDWIGWLGWIRGGGLDWIPLMVQAPCTQPKHTSSTQLQLFHHINPTNPIHLPHSPLNPAGLLY